MEPEARQILSAIIESFERGRVSAEDKKEQRRLYKLVAQARGVEKGLGLVDLSKVQRAELVPLASGHTVAGRAGQDRD